MNRGIGSNALSDPAGSSGKKKTQGIIEKTQSLVNSTTKVLKESLQKVASTIALGKEFLNEKYVAATSPETRAMIREVAVVAAVVSKYTIIGAATLLGGTAIALQTMIYKAQFTSYTVQAGDTLESIGNQFTMTNRKLGKFNSTLKSGLRPGQKIKVRNRKFIEKDYLDQLKSVLKDSLQRHKHGNWSEKIDKLFAKK